MRRQVLYIHFFFKVEGARECTFVSNMNINYEVFTSEARRGGVGGVVGGGGGGGKTGCSAPKARAHHMPHRLVPAFNFC